MFVEPRGLVAYRSLTRNTVAAQVPKISPLHLNMSHASLFQNLSSTDEFLTDLQGEFLVTEMQFKLLEKEFTRVLYTHCPNVKILKRKTNAIVLKGPINEMPTAVAKINTLIKKVVDKRVKLPPDLMTFLKSSGIVSKYQIPFQQNFTNPVCMEVGLDLVLHGLCPHDLDEAVVVLLKGLSVEIEKLQGAAAVPPHTDKIKEILIKAKNQANQGELRVDVTFIPGSTAATVDKVRLVGYTEHVNKLKDVLRDFLLNQLPAEEALKLQHREMVDCFDKVLDLMGMKQTKVTLKASYLPHPCVVVSGPRCWVQEAHQALKSALDRLTSATLVLDGPGALCYFQGDGKVSKELVESSCQVLIKEQQAPVPKTFHKFNLIRNICRTSSTSQQSTFLVLGLRRNHVDDAITKMKTLYQAQCSTKTFTENDLADLTHADMKDLKKLAETQGLYLQENPYGQGGLLVKGLKAGVNQVEQRLHTITPLRREMRLKEEEDLYPRVAWCILGRNGSWERLPKTANYKLEHSDVTKGIMDAQGVTWTVNLQKMEARSLEWATKLKKLENLQDFTLPLYWDNMAAGEDLKEVVVDPDSAEYRNVLEAFRKTADRPVVKIVRVQNVHLRRVYEMQKKHISEKNRQEGAGERLLFHGTSQDSYSSIKTKGFNRSFCGKNATAYGQGTYFAVSAGYSVSYSNPAADGTRSMFMARVLTGIYTLGRSDMKMPPPLSSQKPHDRYDSLVDLKTNPRMFVVFHDDQAYPDYLITFI